MHIVYRYILVSNSLLQSVDICVGGSNWSNTNLERKDKSVAHETERKVIGSDDSCIPIRP